MLAIGQVIEVPNYPFVREQFISFEPNGESFSDEGWRPGCRIENDGPYGEGSYYADETGAMILTVVSLHKPGRYPTRVFFTRQWRDPDGKVFGVQKLRVTTEQAFKRMAKGYRHEFGTIGIEEVTA